MTIGAVIFPREQAEAYLEAWIIAEQKFSDGTLGQERRKDHREAWAHARLRSEQRGDTDGD